MTETTYAGGCRCGAVRYRATGPTRFVGYCHCESCRRSAGAPVVAWVTFKADRFTLTNGALALHQSSAGVRRGACAVCSTSLTYQRDTRAQEMDVTLASLDDPSALAPTCHIYVEEKLPWLIIGDGLPQFKRTQREG